MLERKKSERESTLVNVHPQVCVCTHMYEFLACPYEMCVSHVEQDSRPLRPGSFLDSQSRVM